MYNKNSYTYKYVCGWEWSVSLYIIDTVYGVPAISFYSFKLNTF